jgi:hypothetical protein
VEPASNGGPRDLQLGKQARIAGLADHSPNAVVVGTSSAEGRLHTRIGGLSNQGIS